MQLVVKHQLFLQEPCPLTVFAPNHDKGAGSNLKGALGYHMTYADDILNTWVGIGSQIDGLGHLGENDMLYGVIKQVI